MAALQYHNATLPSLCAFAFLLHSQSVSKSLSVLRQVQLLSHKLNSRLAIRGTYHRPLLLEVDHVLRSLLAAAVLSVRVVVSLAKPLPTFHGRCHGDVPVAC